MFCGPNDRTRSHHPRDARRSDCRFHHPDLTKLLGWRAARAEADMARMTRALIDRVLALGGSYYLPYRPHATVEQFAAAYPRAAAFAAAKRAVDPRRTLRNGLWDTYLEPL
jgi:FAD/FMN-containing dehydrogenase